MRRGVKRLRRRALYGVISVVLPLIRLLPWDLAGSLGYRLGQMGYFLARRERTLALQHLEASLGDRHSESERRAICLAMFGNIGRGALEFPLVRRKLGAPLRRMVDGDHLLGQVKKMLEQGKGAILITGHLGNWELSGAYVAMHFPLNVVARRIYYEPFERIVLRTRAELRMKIVYRDESPRKLLRGLRRNECVTFLADQDMTDVQGVFVDFFGRPAYTATGPISLAIHSGAPVLLVLVVRDGKRFRSIDEPVELVRTGNRKDDLRINTQRWSEILEKYIAMYPDQWPWYHRRWKTTEEVLERRRKQGRAGRRPRR
ncbi:MAG: lysophospholipid acyltransferase family protein [Planctomycetota bacterium]|nr:lysophospholipid acyltransferase family protein [Planctomycetota bacterium]